MNNYSTVNGFQKFSGKGGESEGILGKLTGGFSNLSSTTWMVIGFVLLFLAGALFYYFTYVSPKMKPSYSHNGEEQFTGQQDANGKTAEVLFFFTDWCPHCKTAKPIWNEIKKEYENQTINGYHILFTEIDCSNESAEVEQMMNKYSVEGYPTIKLLKDGQVIEYDAKPSKTTLVQFLNTVI